MQVTQVIDGRIAMKDLQDKEPQGNERIENATAPPHAGLAKDADDDVGLKIVGQIALDLMENARKMTEHTKASVAERGFRPVTPILREGGKSPPNMAVKQLTETTCGLT